MTKNIPCNQPTNQTNQTKQPRAPSAQDAEFEEFWGLYPRKVGKEKARQSWKRLKPTVVLLARIKTTLERQRRSDQWTKDGGQFVPHPTTWLNQGRWDDEPATRNRTEQRNGDAPKPWSCGWCGGVGPRGAGWGGSICVECEEQDLQPLTGKTK